MTTVPTLSSWPSYNEHEIAAVANTLASNKVNYWTGQQCRDFETAFAGWAGSAHAIALTNGTVALDLPLKCLGIGPGDEVIVTPRSFIASVSTVVNAGATPVFADVEPDSGNISAATIERVMTDRTRAVIPVHIAGWPCDMPSIMDLSNDRGIVVIEDCAQAHGAAIGNRMVGTFGHAAAWSFCQDKIMTTGGEGGMVTTDDPSLWNTMWSFKDHGKSWDTVYNKKHQPGFRWVHESFGTNWRMLEMQAAIGLLQLNYLADWTARRTAIAQKIASTLVPYSDIVRCPHPDPAAVTHAFYRLYAYVRPEALATGWSRDRIVAEVNSAGAPLLHGTCSEIYLEKAFDGTPWRPADRLPNAKDLGETSLMFLVHPTLIDAEVEYCCQIVAKVLNAARR